MKKVIIIGCCGSGKSTFARQLHACTGIPLFHLDQLNWNADKTTVEKEVFLKRVQDVIQKNSWIIVEIMVLLLRCVCKHVILYSS